VRINLSPFRKPGLVSAAHSWEEEDSYINVMSASLRRKFRLRLFMAADISAFMIPIRIELSMFEKSKLNVRTCIKSVEMHSNIDLLDDRHVKG
jgi:hypothetical protein